MPTVNLCRRTCPVLLVGLGPYPVSTWHTGGPSEQESQKWRHAYTFQRLLPLSGLSFPTWKGGWSELLHAPDFPVSTVLGAELHALRSSSIPFWFPGSHASVHTDCRRVQFSVCLLFPSEPFPPGLPRTVSSGHPRLPSNLLSAACLGAD